MEDVYVHIKNNSGPQFITNYVKYITQTVLKTSINNNNNPLIYYI